MPKAAIVLLAGTDGVTNMGRMANALMAVHEFKEAGDEVRLIFDGAGTQWLPELAKPDHKYHDVFEGVKDTVAGVCDYCAGAFNVKQQVQDAGLPLAGAHKGHPSFRELVRDGFQVITF